MHEAVRPEVAQPAVLPAFQSQSEEHTPHPVGVPPPFARPLFQLHVRPAPRNRVPAATAHLASVEAAGTASLPSYHRGATANRDVPEKEEAGDEEDAAEAPPVSPIGTFELTNPCTYSR